MNNNNWKWILFDMPPAGQIRSIEMTAFPGYIFVVFFFLNSYIDIIILYLYSVLFSSWSDIITSYYIFSQFYLNYKILYIYIRIANCVIIVRDTFKTRDGNNIIVYYVGGVKNIHVRTHNPAWLLFKASFVTTISSNIFLKSRVGLT